MSRNGLLKNEESLPARLSNRNEVYNSHLRHRQTLLEALDTKYGFFVDHKKIVIYNCCLPRPLQCLIYFNLRYKRQSAILLVGPNIIPLGNHVLNPHKTESINRAKITSPFVHLVYRRN